MKGAKESLIALLVNFCSHLYKFQYDKAKEIVDEFRNKRLPNLQLPIEEATAWTVLLQNLSPLASADKCYMTLSFLLPRGFLRKESPLRSNYTSIKNELIKLASPLKDAVFGQPEDSCKYLVGHLCQQFAAYITARMDLMNCYENLSMVLRQNGITVDQAVELVSDIQAKHKGTFHHPAIEFLEQSFCYEVDILMHLLKCNQKLMNFMFIDCLYHFREAQSSLKIWSNESTDGTVLKFHQSSSWFSLTGSSKIQSLPSVCIWLKRFYDYVLAKFTLYYYELLSEQTNSQEMRAQISKLTVNYYQDIATFHRKHDAANICILLNVQNLGHFQWKGYSHASQPHETLKGLENYPIIFCYPTEHPLYLLPSAVMILTEYADQLLATERIIDVFDKTKETMFFVTRVESCVFLVLTFNNWQETQSRNRKDTVIEYISKLCYELRCVPVFSSLKLKS